VTYAGSRKAAGNPKQYGPPFRRRSDEPAAEHDRSGGSEPKPPFGDYRPSHPRRKRSGWSVTLGSPLNDCGGIADCSRAGIRMTSHHPALPVEGSLVCRRRRPPNAPLCRDSLVADEGKPIKMAVAVQLCWLPVTVTPELETEALLCGRGLQDSPRSRATSRR
jgi:hypothetical protein